MNITKVIGIDPDSKCHGVAVYECGKLVSLSMLDLFDVVNLAGDGVLFSIEHVAANSFVYARNDQKNKRLQAKVGVSIGRCQQAQIELCRWLERINQPYVLHKPTQFNWSKNKMKFEQITGWQGSSNEDTRSAAYFGWVEADKKYLA